MTTTTQREIRSEIRGGAPALDSPAVPARARAKVYGTQRDVKADRRKHRIMVPGLDNWWVWTTTPASFRDTWNASKIDRSRIPADNTALRMLWHVSNWTDRLIMFALIELAPKAFTGPLRWCATRPTRRYALYIALNLFITSTYLTHLLIGA